MVNTQERSNKSAHVSEIEQLKTDSTTNNNSVGSTSSITNSSSISTTLNSSSPQPQSHTFESSTASVSAQSVSTPTPINFAKNASAQAATAGTQQNHHKLIPIQSVLHTADHQHYNQQHHHTHHNSSLNHSSANLQLQQSGTTSHLNAQTSTLQQFINSGGVSGAGVSTTTNHAQLPTELPHEDEERLGNLFNRLDRDGNGRIDIHDLSEALREFGLSSVYAEVIFFCLKKMFLKQILYAHFFNKPILKFSYF